MRMFHPKHSKPDVKNFAICRFDKGIFNDRISQDA